MQYYAYLEIDGVSDDDEFDGGSGGDEVNGGDNENDGDNEDGGDGDDNVDVDVFLKQRTSAVVPAPALNPVSTITLYICL